jgi:hypothetical protein
LAPNSIDTWPTLEQRFHEYFYNREAKLRLSDLTAIRQKHNETIPEYLRGFRETRNKCYNLTVEEKDHADLAFAGLSSYLKEKLEGQEFLDMNQVLQRVVMHENHAKDQRSYSRFRDSSHKERGKGNVSYLEEGSVSNDEGEVCVAEWVNTPGNKPISCSFLKHGVGKKDEMKYTFDVSKCDKLFDVLVKGG